MNTYGTSPIASAFDILRAESAAWNADIGRPRGSGWISGEEMRNATVGPLNELLNRIGERAGSDDKLTIAASFALRFGWSSAMAIAPYLRFHCVPDVALDNVSFRFAPATSFERAAMYMPRGAVVEGDARAAHESMTTVSDADALLKALRNALTSQSAPIVDALHRWSGFAPRATWGMLTSSWASQFTSGYDNPRDLRDVMVLLDAFFAGEDLVAEMRPRISVVSSDGNTGLYQRRASCCRFYLLPSGNLCASCPLVSDDERHRRNVEWMQTQRRS